MPTARALLRSCPLSGVQTGPCDCRGSEGAPGSKGPNTTLNEELQGQTETQQLTVNPSTRAHKADGMQYRGSLEAGAILRALCAPCP